MSAIKNHSSILVASEITSALMRDKVRKRRTKTPEPALPDFQFRWQRILDRHCKQGSDRNQANQTRLKSITGSNEGNSNTSDLTLGGNHEAASSVTFSKNPDTANRMTSAKSKTWDGSLETSFRREIHTHKNASIGAFA